MSRSTFETWMRVVEAPLMALAAVNVTS